MTKEKGKQRSTKHYIEN